MSTPPSVRGWTSMSVRKETYKRVKEAKRGGQTFDELLTELVEESDRDV